MTACGEPKAGTIRNTGTMVSGSNTVPTTSCRNAEPGSPPTISVMLALPVIGGAASASTARKPAFRRMSATLRNASPNSCQGLRPFATTESEILGMSMRLAGAGAIISQCQ